MKIITRGILPGERLYRLNCSNCNTIFECLQKELTPFDSRDERDYGKMEITCPLEGCGTKVIAGRAHLVPEPGVPPLSILNPPLSILNYPHVRSMECRGSDLAPYGAYGPERD